MERLPLQRRGIIDKYLIGIRSVHDMPISISMGERFAVQRPYVRASDGALQGRYLLRYFGYNVCQRLDYSAVSAASALERNTPLSCCGAMDLCSYQHPVYICQLDGHGVLSVHQPPYYRLCIQSVCQRRQFGSHHRNRVCASLVSGSAYAAVGFWYV